MELKLMMTLLSDTIFGNGESIPGGEDISVLTDSKGFPYYKGGTFKGVFREELENLLDWQPDLTIKVADKLGGSDDDIFADGKLRFYDFEIPQTVKIRVNGTIQKKEDVLDAFTYLRTFTEIEDKTGTAKKGTLRLCRCIKAGITFYGRIECLEEDKAWIEEVLGLIKWIGTMRNRGFGKVQIKIVQ